MRNIKSYLLLILKGIGMGSADVIPGVSGGTVAFITGIYDELLGSIKSVDLTAFKTLFALKFKAFWAHINGNFLLAIFTGIAISIVSLAKLMGYLLTNHPILTWAFFFGLIIVSAMLVAKDITEKNWKVVLSGILGIVIAYFITEISPAQTPDNLGFVFLSGSIAICAMILPGISGAFILLILGKYQYVLAAIDNFEVGTIGVFMVGCVVGLLLFSRVISWCLTNYKSITIAMLAGFMIGSLNKVWPWKIVDSYRLNRHGEQVPFIDHNVLPQEYLQQTGNDPHLIQALLLASFGILFVLLIEKIAARFKPEEK